MQQKYIDMITITEKNRSFVFLVITLFIGIFLIGGMLFFETSTPEGVNGPNGDPDGGPEFKKIENKINELKSKNFDPSCFNTIKIEIDSYYDLGIFQSSSKSYLTTKLTSGYSDLVYKQCEFFLSNNIGTSQEVSSWLNQLEQITSSNSKIDNYKNQIKWYNYYATTLPNAVDAFIAPGITNYEENLYTKLKQEVQTMPNFDPSYKNSSKFNGIRTNLTSKLESFNTAFYSAGL